MVVYMSTDDNQYKKLLPNQFAAICASIKLGYTIKTDFPQIAEDYRSGLSLTQIVRKYQLTSMYKVGVRTAINAVHRALVGHGGGFNLESYEGLIVDYTEIKDIGRDHLSKPGKELYRDKRGVFAIPKEELVRYSSMGGRLASKEKLGIHGRSREQMTMDGKKGGIIGGRIVQERRLGIFSPLYRTEDGALTQTGRERLRELGLRLFKEKKGIHGRSCEKMSIDGRRAGRIAGNSTFQRKVGVHGRTQAKMSEDGRESALARGLIPWQPAKETDTYYAFSEIEYAYRLSMGRDFQTIGGLSDNKKISEMLNELFHDNNAVRSSHSVQIALSKYRKKLRQ